MKPSEDFFTRHEGKIDGVLGCYARIVMNGTLTAIAPPEARARVLGRHGVRCFDFGQFLDPLREQIRKNAERLAQESGLPIEWLPSSRGVRKEALVAESLAQRGRLPGLVHILSALENCTTFRPWHDKATGQTGRKFTGGKCLHCYFYRLDPQLGLM